jgi:hypothetical protein
MEILGGACLLPCRNGTPVLPDRGTAADTTLTKALARAWRHVGKGPISDLAVSCGPFRAA